MNTGILENANIWTTSTQFKGSIIWLENGICLRERFSSLCSTAFRRFHYRKVELPFFIPEQIYKAQPKHFEGLASHTFSILADQDFVCYLRTTSETPFTFLFKNLWSGNKFPLLFFQEVCVFRRESTGVRPPIRSIEINPFIESYSASLGSQENDERIATEVNIYSHILDSLNLNYVISRRPFFDTFPEALFTIAFDALLPDGTVSQVATVHNLGSSFSEAFNWKVGTVSPLQTSTGISARAIAISLLNAQKGDALYIPECLRGDFYLSAAFLFDDKHIQCCNSRTRKAKLICCNNLDEIKEAGQSLISFPLSDNTIALERMRTLLPPDFACLGFAHPMTECREVCVVFGTTPAFLCYAGKSI